MLTTHNTYNVLHRGKTFFGFPLLPSFVLLLCCLLVGAIVNMLSAFPYLTWMRILNDVNVAIFFIGIVALWMIERLDFHAFGLLRWQFAADYRNGTRECHHYVDEDDSHGKAQAKVSKSFYSKIGNATPTDNMLVVDNGTVITGIALSGKAYFTASDDDINTRSTAFAAMLAEITDSDVTVRVMHHHHGSTKTPLADTVRSPFEGVIREAWDKAQQQQDFYENHYALMLSINVLGDTQQATLRRQHGDARGMKWTRKKEKALGVSQEAIHHAIARLTVLRDNVLSAATPFSARPLSIASLQAWRNLPLQFTGDSQRPIDIGDAIYYHATKTQPARYGACLSVLGLPDKIIQNASITALHALSAEYVFTHAGSPVENQKIKNILTWTKNLTGDTLGDKGGDSAELTESAQRAYRGVEHFYKMQHTLMVFADSREQLEVVVREATQLFTRAGILVRRDGFFLNTLFFSQVPGCESRLARSLLMTKEVIAALSLPLQSQTNQHRTSHLPSAALTLPTLDNNRFYLHCHQTQEGNTPATEPLPGTMLMIGPTGYGKTIFQQIVMHGLGRFGGKSVVFDNDNSQTANILASGGVVNVINPDSGTLSLNPFLMPDTPSNMAFLAGWLARLCLADGETRNPAIAKHISERLTKFMLTTRNDKTLRTLSHFTVMLGKDFSRHDYLQDLCRNAYEGDTEGKYAFLFDNDTDALDFTASVVGFDMTWLLSDTVMPEAIKDAFFSYLFYRLNQFYAADSSLTTVFVEEAHQVFKSLYWQDFLVTDIPRVRKKNVQYCFASQFPQQLFDTPVGGTLANSYAHLYALANNKMDEKTIRAFKGFGLSESEINIIETMPEHKHLALVKPKSASVHSEVVSTHANLGDCFSILQGGDKRAEVLRGVLGDNEVNTDIHSVITEFNKRWAV